MLYVCLRRRIKRIVYISHSMPLAGVLRGRRTIRRALLLLKLNFQCECWFEIGIKFRAGRILHYNRPV